MKLEQNPCSDGSHFDYFRFGESSEEEKEEAEEEAIEEVSKFFGDKEEKVKEYYDVLS